MRIGLFLNTQIEDPAQSPAAVLRELLEQVDAANRLGFDCVFAGQHFLAHPYAMFQPIPLLARISAAAGEMRIGTGVILAAHAHPLVLAEEAATMDAVTGGRFILGAGLGYRDVEFDSFRLNKGTRAKTFEAHLSAVISLLEGRMTNIDTHPARVTNAVLSLLPVQRPRPPVWLAANNRKGIERAARMTDGWLINPHARVDTLETQVQVFNDHRSSAGLPPGEVPLIREACVGESDAEAAATARKYLEPKYRAYVSWGQDKALPSHDPLDREFDDLAADRFVIGSAATVGEMLVDICGRVGTQLVLLRVQWPGMPHERAMETIERLGEAVMPLVKAA
jgi:alkanesulfonate monooxygenase SsuD/methylene tetrahydromethanopterin reductase-like flavin-dependent oxidoreductase (luciferase family)